MKLTDIQWIEAENYFRKNDTVMIVTGSIESHGTHNPLGVDYIIPDYISNRLNDMVDILIAPTIPYGSCDSLSGFSGTISISDEGFYDIINRIVKALLNHGAKKFVFLNGHGGNVNVLKRVCLELDDKGFIGTILNWWIIAGDLNPEIRGGHGGAQETSAIMAINPKLVKMNDIREMNLKNMSDNIVQKGYYNIEFKGIEIPVPRNIRKLTDNGWIGPDHPLDSDPKKGKEMLDETINFIAEYINEFKDLKEIHYG